ncbi:MAG: hypothetical protein QNL59_07010 [Actinomycetota bacterium]
MRNRLTRRASRPSKSAASARQADLVCAPWYSETYIVAGDVAQDPIAHFLQHKGGNFVDPTPLFDGHWYRTVHGLHAVAEPLDHYLTVGASIGLDPSPAFDSIWYLRQVGELPRGMTPLEHYVKVGGHAAIDPHPLFSTAWYLQQLEGGLDGLTPLEHYLAFGWRQNLDPCALFSANGYLHRNPDVAVGGVNPFVHYLKFGSSEGREGTCLWAEAEYRSWFADDVLVQRLGSLAHYRQIAIPSGRTIAANPSIDRVARLRVSLEDHANRLLHTSDDGETPAFIDWLALAGSLSFERSTDPRVAVVVTGGGHGALRTLECLQESASSVPFEVIVVGEDPASQAIPGVVNVSANLIDLHAVWTAALSVSTAPLVVLLESGIAIADGWLDELTAQVAPSVGVVASVIVGDDLSLQESGRFTLDDGATVRFGADDRVGRWMYGVDREIDSCSLFGSLIRRSLLSDWLVSSGSPSHENSGELLSEFVRGAGSTVVVAARAVIIERFDIEVSDRAGRVPFVEHLRRRDRRAGSHVIVVDRSITGYEGAPDSERTEFVLRSLGESGRIVHLIPADMDRAQPRTEQYEIQGIEVIDAPIGSEELLALVHALDGRIEFVLIADPHVGVWWASFLLEHLGQVPLAYDSVGVDPDDERNAEFERHIARMADVVIINSGDEAQEIERRVGLPLASVVSFPSNGEGESRANLQTLFDAISAVATRQI